MDPGFAWPAGIRCAVSLTYDDGLPIHPTHVGPALEQYGLRATFYPPTLSDIHHQPDRWRRLAAAGHELGNHTIFHPCRRSPADKYQWLEECYDLCTYSAAHLRAELEVANFVLTLIDGQTERTYGNTCCHTTIGQGADEQPMEGILADLFVAARGALTSRVAQPRQPLDLLNVGCIAGDGRSLAELLAIMDEARMQGGWAVLMMHGIGPETHSFHIDSDVHQHFISWLAAQHQTVWAAPVVEIARYIRSRSSASSQ